MAKFPTVNVWVIKDANQGNLGRIQIIKGWVAADGSMQEKIINVTRSDDRELAADGGLPQQPEPRGQACLSQILREPLLHFVLIGAALFAAYQLAAGDSEVGNEKRIVIDRTTVQRLVDPFERAWLRKPTGAELNGLIQGYLKDEVLYREAVELGLDRDDHIVRRRMRQKMEFLNHDLTEPPEPSDEVLQAYMETREEHFRKPAEIAFSQVFFRFDGSADGRLRIQTQRADLTGQAPREIDFSAFGDATMLPVSMAAESASRIAGVFGRGFADELFALPPGQWVGPIESSYGWHLVFISDAIAAGSPDLGEVRQAVEREWRAEQRTAANDRFYKILLDRYVVERRDTEPFDAKLVAE